MASKAISIRQIERARLQSRDLSWGVLQELAIPCLSWCHDFLHRTPVDIAGAFRSSELKEASHKVFPFSCHTEFSEDLTESFAEFLQVREKASGPYRMGLDDARQELRRPMALLMTDWTASLFDGALTPETHGFLDDDCMPPWNTWLSLVKVNGSHGLGCLLSWVPEWLASKMDLAIQVDAAECLSWATIHEDGQVLPNGWGRPWDSDPRSHESHEA